MAFIFCTWNNAPVVNAYLSCFILFIVPVSHWECAFILLVRPLHEVNKICFWWDIHPANDWLFLRVGEKGLVYKQRLKQSIFDKKLKWIIHLSSCWLWCVQLFFLHLLSMHVPLVPVQIGSDKTRRHVAIKENVKHEKVSRKIITYYTKEVLAVFFRFYIQLCFLVFFSRYLYSTFINQSTLPSEIVGDYSFKQKKNEELF